MPKQVSAKEFPKVSHPKTILKICPPDSLDYSVYYRYKTNTFSLNCGDNDNSLIQIQNLDRFLGREGGNFKGISQAISLAKALSPVFYACGP